MIKEKLRGLLEGSKFVDILIQILIMVCIVQASLETMPSLRDKYKNVWEFSEKFFIIVFSIEYLLRIYIADKKIKFIFSFYGLIDLVAILPSILAFSFLDSRFLRSIRLLRILRIFKLARYLKALNRLQNSLKDIKEEVALFFVLSMLLLYVSASGIYYFEYDAQPEIFKSIPHSLWWAVSTLTTVGYGDIYPVTIGGKVFTFFIMMLGIGIISVPSGLFASSFSKNRK